MKIKDLFNLHNGNGFELYNMELSDTSEVSFVSRTGQNNGVVAKVKADETTVPFPAGFITVALGGSVLSSFVQDSPFYTAFHIMVLEPKSKMTFNEKLFYCMCIKKNAYRYSYGRQANRTLGEIELPDKVPSWIGDIKISPITTSIVNTKTINTENWCEYTIDDLFVIKKGKRLTKADMLPGQINFIGAISENNGIREQIDTSIMSDSNCITVNYNGSVGEAFYQNEPFRASDDVNILYAKNYWNMNKYVAMFLITIIKSNKFRFGYGRKWTLEKMKATVIKLPCEQDGKPDFIFMEQYIRALPYSDRI